MVEDRKALSYLPDAGVWPEALSFCGEVSCIDLCLVSVAFLVFSLKVFEIFISSWWTAIFGHPSVSSTALSSA